MARTQAEIEAIQLSILLAALFLIIPPVIYLMARNRNSERIEDEQVSSPARVRERSKMKTACTCSLACTISGKLFTKRTIRNHFRSKKNKKIQEQVMHK